jgi:HEAT repeat protein
VPLVRKPGGTPPAPVSPADASSVFAKLVSDRAEDRWAAARDAAELPGAAPALAAALGKEADPRVREAMFTGLARIGTRESADLLISILRSDSSNLRAGALDALRTMVGSTKDLLPPLLVDPDVDIRVLSCELARTLPGPEATALLASLLARETDVNVCAAALDVLAEVGGPAAIPALDACARRFGESPFLAFAIKAATDRIHAQRPPSRA